VIAGPRFEPTVPEGTGSVQGTESRVSINYDPANQRRRKEPVSSPIQVQGVTKVPAKRGSEIGEHNDEVLKELGFDATEIEELRVSGAIPKERAKVS